MLKVLFCSLRYDYGNPQAGMSLEYKSLFGSLQHMPGVQVEFFGFDEIMSRVGRDEMNNLLLKQVKEQRPNLLFCCLFTEEIKKETIAEITKNTPTKTFNWFGDDNWRVPVFSRFWAPLFTMVSTTDSQALQIYKSYGINNVIKTRWGANPHLYFPQDENLNPRNLEVTFIGQKFGRRPLYIKQLRRNNILVQTFGSGWAEGLVDHQRMLEIYSWSKINLNFSETPYYGFRKKFNLLAKLFIKKELGKYSLNVKNFWSNWLAAKSTQRRPVKARVFEVLACGGFLLTGKSDEPVEQIYQPGKEIVVFDSQNDLIDKVRYYLQHDKERQEIAAAGFERTIKEHTYAKRFKEIFQSMQLM